MQLHPRSDENAAAPSLLPLNRPDIRARANNVNAREAVTDRLNGFCIRDYESCERAQQRRTMLAQPRSALLRLRGAVALTRF